MSIVERGRFYKKRKHFIKEAKINAFLTILSPNSKKLKKKILTMNKGWTKH